MAGSQRGRRRGWAGGIEVSNLHPRSKHLTCGWGTAGGKGPFRPDWGHRAGALGASAPRRIRILTILDGRLHNWAAIRQTGFDGDGCPGAVLPFRKEWS